MDGKMKIVSACLLGTPCRYDGKSQLNGEAARLFNEGNCVPVCPECLGGLPIPRASAEIVGGSGEDVLDGRARVMARQENGEMTDVTASFIDGAQKTLEAARRSGAAEALLKAKSPSCGCGMIYDGSFSRTLKSGNGVTAALLMRHGIAVRTL